MYIYLPLLPGAYQQPRPRPHTDRPSRSQRTIDQRTRRATDHPAYCPDRCDPSPLLLLLLVLLVCG